RYHRGMRYPTRLTVPVSVTRHGGRPLHEQIAAQLGSAVDDGLLVTEMRLPSSRTLAELLGVSRGVVDAAYDTLLARGYLDRRRGTDPAAATPHHQRHAAARRRAGSATGRRTGDLPGRRDQPGRSGATGQAHVRGPTPGDRGLGSDRRPGDRDRRWYGAPGRRPAAATVRPGRSRFHRGRWSLRAVHSDAWSRFRDRAPRPGRPGRAAHRRPRRPAAVRHA